MDSPAVMFLGMFFFGISWTLNKILYFIFLKPEQQKFVTKWWVFWVVDMILWHVTPETLNRILKIPTVDQDFTLIILTFLFPGVAATIIYLFCSCINIYRSKKLSLTRW
ncbi:MAG: hypothetical protein IPI58_01570 [Alphaproteobacteria bacterium]|nr:MAG: hypothetical protein IPI58_01570 [Alphaproteobacteria bacterium]